MGDFDYLMETLDEVSNQVPEQDSLAKLKALVELYKNQKDAVDSLEEQLSQAKAAFYKTSKELIPNLLMQNGLSEIKLPSGEKVQVKMDVSPTITDMEAFAKFLDERGESNILKTQMELGKMDASILRSSPRTWGCFRELLYLRCLVLVFPTHVGVFPVSQKPRYELISLPHARGGVSVRPSIPVPLN